MKPELLVIVDQLRHGEYVLSPCTHRPSHHPSWMHPKIFNQPACRREIIEGVFGKGDEVVTRQPYRKVRLDHLLSRDRKKVYPKLSALPLYFFLGLIAQVARAYP